MSGRGRPFANERREDQFYLDYVDRSYKTVEGIRKEIFAKEGVWVCWNTIFKRLTGFVDRGLVSKCELSSFVFYYRV